MQELRNFIAKIGFDNAPSQNLFRKLGFQEQGRSQVFREATFKLEVSEDVKAWLEAQAPATVAYKEYD